MANKTKTPVEIEEAEDTALPAVPEDVSVDVPVVDEVIEAPLPTARRRRRRASLDARTAELLTRIYLTKRIHYQMDWYKSRMTENDYNDGTMFKIAAWVMSISSVLAMGGVVSESPVLPLLTALLPPMAALIASFRSLYQWDKQNSIYQDTILGLEQAKLTLPDLDDMDARTAFRIYPELVRQAESAFEKEAQQWGQIAAGKTEEGEQIDAVERFANEFGVTIMDDQGYVDEAKLDEFRTILQSSQNQTRTQRRPVDGAASAAPPPDDLG